MSSVTSSSAMASATSRAPPQGGVLEGVNPAHYDQKNPIILFIIQASIIIMFCRLLHWPLARIRQPKVIAEVIGGILLGPSVMGRIPGFSKTIFPTESIPNLNLVANLGLVLFLFLVGLEVDLRRFVANWRIALSVGMAGMAIPFALGVAIAYGLFREFRNEPDTVEISFGVYSLFIGVAMAITAFPVLCRILTELDLLRTPVGLIVLSAGVGNDVLGWILLALCVALVNAGTGLTALWVLLVCVGYSLFLGFAVRPVFMWYLRRERALQDGPSQSVVTVTLLIVLASSFLTGVIGVHAIFGAFMAGLICPHDGGFAIKITEKVEDLIGSLFLPLYFALSGLSTNLGLLDSGIAWAYVIGIIAVAFFGKFVGGTIAARLNGLVWRESATIGVFMSCKGLVELIVLNIGLQAKILSVRTFTMFVVMALVVTFTTTPLVQWLYPPWYQRKLEAWKRGEIDWNSDPPSDEQPEDALNKLQSSTTQKLLVYLRLDTLPSLLTFVSLLGGKQDPPRDSISSDSLTKEGGHTTVRPKEKALEVHGLRLLQLTDRQSSDMRVSAVDEDHSFDPVLNAFRILGQLYNLLVSGDVSVVPESSYAETLISKAYDEQPDLLLLPWSETGSMSEAQTVTRDSARKKLADSTYASFVNRVLVGAACNTAVLINERPSMKTSGPTLHRTVSTMSAMSVRGQWRRGTAANDTRSNHFFLPYFGGADGRLALRLVLQLAQNADVTATVVHYHIATDQSTASSNDLSASAVLRQTRDDAAFLATIRDSLPANLQHRVIFITATTPATPQDTVSRVQEEVGEHSQKRKVMVVLGRDVDMSASQDSSNGLGTMASAVLASDAQASLLVVQARKERRESLA